MEKEKIKKIGYYGFREELTDLIYKKNKNMFDADYISMHGVNRFLEENNLIKELAPESTAHKIIKFLEEKGIIETFEEDIFVKK